MSPANCCNLSIFYFSFLNRFDPRKRVFLITCLIKVALARCTRLWYEWCYMKVQPSWSSSSDRSTPVEASIKPDKFFVSNLSASPQVDLRVKTVFFPLQWCCISCWGRCWSWVKILRGCKMIIIQLCYLRTSDLNNQGRLVDVFIAALSADAR